MTTLVPIENALDEFGLNVLRTEKLCDGTISQADREAIAESYGDGAVATDWGIRIPTSGRALKPVADGNILFAACAESVVSVLHQYQEMANKAADILFRDTRRPEGLFALNKPLNDPLNGGRSVADWHTAIDQIEELDGDAAQLFGWMNEPKAWQKANCKCVARGDFFYGAILRPTNKPLQLSSGRKVDIHRPASQQQHVARLSKFFSNKPDSLKIVKKYLKLIGAQSNWLDEEIYLALLMHRHGVAAGEVLQCTLRTNASWSARTSNFKAVYEGTGFTSGSEPKLREMINLYDAEPQTVRDSAAYMIEENAQGREICEKLGIEEPKLHLYKQERLRVISIRNTGGRNVIYSGAPGTGKSWKIKEITKDEPLIRTMFHPEYTNSDFVGVYRPVVGSEADAEDTIFAVGGDKEVPRPVSYFEFVPGPMARAIVLANNNPERKINLVIEEINRGDCAAIFGQFFQLLDRNSDGSGEYGITPPPELEQFLMSEAEGSLSDDAEGGGKLCMPSNLTLMATMNTADESLYPMDAAFRRRWEWEVVPVEPFPPELETVKLNDGHKELNWPDLLRKINRMIVELRRDEDARIGPWFVRPDDDMIDKGQFRNKLLYYLWGTVLKNYRARAFADKLNTFEALQKAFDDNGVKGVINSTWLSDADHTSDVEQNIGDEGSPT